MNKFNYLLIFCLFFGLVSFAQTETSEKKEVKAKKSEVLAKSSRISWTGFKPMGQHKGQLAIQSGNLEFKEKQLSGGEIIVDMNSLTCTDIEDEATNGKLVGHLKSADFFNAVEFGTAKIKVKRVIPYGAFDTTSDESTGEVYKVTADLTIKDIVSRIHIDRTDFGLQYGSGSFFDDLGDKLIYDDFMIDIALAVKTGSSVSIKN